LNKISRKVFDRRKSLFKGVPSAKKQQSPRQDSDVDEKKEEFSGSLLINKKVM
jgi:hypothetical protein